MSNVMWILWLADVASALTGAALFSGVILAVVVFLSGFFVVESGDIPEIVTKLKSFLWFLVVVVIVGAVVPSATTIRIIAGAEATRLAADTQLGKTTIDAVNAALQEVIDKNKKK